VTTTPTATPADVSLRARVEDFLYAEAALLDGWQLDDWYALFTPDSRYVVPALDRNDLDPNSSLTLMDDDNDRLSGRVVRLKSRRAHREFPWSVTRRIVGNVRVSVRGDGDLAVDANFIVNRFRKQETHTFVGRYEYLLVEDTARPAGFGIRSKYCYLDNERLSPHGSLSILL
jgi:p-cumate 2,3-dioxygenase subunit beta